jgi:large conductance mechanosensitive channel
MLKEFKEFALRGNVVDLAIALVLGIAFGKIITSFVTDILMPPIGLAIGRIDFASLFVNLGPRSYATLQEAKAAGAPTINYGLFLQTIVDFVIVAFVIFLLVRQLNRMRRPAPAAAPATRECAYCFSPVALRATRCPHCTSELAPAAR